MVSIFECTQELVFSDVPKIAFAARVSTNIVNLITQDNDISLSKESFYDEKFTFNFAHFVSGSGYTSNGWRGACGLARIWLRVNWFIGVWNF